MPENWRGAARTTVSKIASVAGVSSLASTAMVLILYLPLCLDIESTLVFS